MSLEWRCSTGQVASDTERGIHAAAESTKDGGKPDHAVGMLGASLTAGDEGRPYLIGQLWSRTEGKPAVRNLRGDDGDGGIIRSPQRAIVLPDVQRRSVADLVSESLIRGNCPVDAVVISTSGKGDRPV